MKQTTSGEAPACSLGVLHMQGRYTHVDVFVANVLQPEAHHILGRRGHESLIRKAIVPTAHVARIEAHGRPWEPTGGR